MRYAYYMERGHIGRLQALRFFASFGVLIAHVQHEIHSRLNGPSDILSAFPFMIGVDVFFVISGFIIWHISVGEFGKPKAAPHFLLRRIIRVVPLYWIATSLMVVIASVSAGVVNTVIYSQKQVLASYLFIPYGDFIPVLKLGWTLNYEMLFYVVFGVALLFRRTIGLLIISGILTLLVGLGDVLPSSNPIGFWGNSVVFTFLCGIGLSVALRAGWSLSITAAVSTVFFGFAVAYLMHKQGYTEETSPRFLCLGVAAVLISAGVILYRPNGEAGSVIRVLEWAGDSSYSLYLSHMFSIRACLLCFRKAGLTNPWLFGAMAILTAIVVGVLVRVYIERPVTDFLRHRLDRSSSHVR